MFTLDELEKISNGLGLYKNDLESILRDTYDMYQEDENNTDLIDMLGSLSDDFLKCDELEEKINFYMQMIKYSLKNNK